MAELRTWQLLADVEACLAQITVANGFHTDAGQNVTREPEQIPEDSGAVLAVVLEGLAPATQPGISRTHRLATVAIVGKLAGRDQERLHQLIQDIELSLLDKTTGFGPGRSSPTFVSATPIPPAEGIPWVGVTVRYAAHVLLR